MNKTDKDILRRLATEIAEIAALPVQEEKRRLWRGLNGLHPERPMVMIDQVCWNEVNVDGALSPRCQDPDCRRYEEEFRKALYQWRHFPVDAVVEPFLRVPLAVHSTGFGFHVQEETVATEADNQVVSHKYENLFQDDADLEKIKNPVVTHDRAETERRMAVAHELFDGILEIRPGGMEPYLSIWDPISMWMPVEDALFALIDRPEYMHELARRITEGYLALLDQLEAQGLLCQPQSLIHCTGAWTDELPAPGYDPGNPRTRDNWMFGLAQMFSTVSPAMFREFEVDYTRRICERFGLVYYGCCDPLDGKMAEVRLLPNVRKVSMSPWADPRRGAAEIGRNYVFSSKPNPAHVAMTRFDEDLIRTELATTLAACREHGCPLEFILKDISTVRHEPERLDQWARIAMETVGAA
jgi:hypothetical protein